MVNVLDLQALSTPSFEPSCPSSHSVIVIVTNFGA
ncbi:hypothetical protein BXY51_008713 [Actinoplanes cyaneus]|nr:hypothetical protein [Actinoplanes cyaneus]